MKAPPCAFNEIVGKIRVLSLEVRTPLASAALGERLKVFFGEGGLGLEAEEEGPGQWIFRGGAGHVRATLRPEGKAKLDDVVAKSQQLVLEVVIAVGHADRIGSTAYNQKLSEKRAASVKDYLVAKGIPANRIYTEGKGSKQPVTKPDQCKGPKSAKVIACLQPDRRVDIEIIGTKK